MSSTLTKYAKHSTTIHKQVRTRGTVMEVTEVVVGYVTERIMTVKDEAGTHLMSNTLIMYPPDTDVDEEDRIEVAGKTLTVRNIARPRFVGRSPNHLEVLLY